MKNAFLDCFSSLICTPTKMLQSGKFSCEFLIEEIKKEELFGDSAFHDDWVNHIELKEY